MRAAQPRKPCTHPSYLRRSSVPAKSILEDTFGARRRRGLLAKSQAAIARRSHPNLFAPPTHAELILRPLQVGAPHPSSVSTNSARTSATWRSIVSTPHPSVGTGGGPRPPPPPRPGAPPRAPPPAAAGPHQHAAH